MRKSIFLMLLCILESLPAFAQEQDFSEDEFRQKIDSVFQYVDLKQVETGILIEHGFNLLDPKWRGGFEADCDNQTLILPNRMGGYNMLCSIFPLIL